MKAMFGPKHQGGHGGPDGQGGCRKGAWKLDRAKVVSVPDEVLTGAPGQTLVAKIEFMNNTHWPYKPGCCFRSRFSGKANEILEEVMIPLDFQVSPQQTCSLSVPLKIGASAMPTKDSGEQYHVASFSFAGPNGWFFGEEFNVKFRVDGQLDEVAFYQMAMDIFEELQEAHPHLEFTRVSEVLRNCGNNPTLAKEILSKNPKKAGQTVGQI